MSLELLLPLDFFLGQLRCGKLKLPDKAKVDLHLLYPVAVDFFRGVDDDFLNNSLIMGVVSSEKSVYFLASSRNCSTTALSSAKADSLSSASVEGVRKGL